MSVSSFNRRWAQVIIAALTHHQVRHICIAPGSRSAPLTLAAAAEPALICHTHFDERGLGFLALGLAKASRSPVALIVTSGTAVANLLPAVIEAQLTGERLIVLSADRPPELINCGANQAITQPGIFSHFARRCDLPRPTPEIGVRWLAATLDETIAAADAGALHVNCPFAEPLYGPEDDAWREWLTPLDAWPQQAIPWVTHSAPCGQAQQSDWLRWRQKRGVVIAGKMRAEEGAAVAPWAATLGWPLLADIQSQTGQPLPRADLWLNSPQAQQQLNQAELVVQFGANLISKRLLQWQQQARPQQWWLIDALPGRRDPSSQPGRRIVSQVGSWINAHPAAACTPWAPTLHTLAATMQRQASAAVVNEPEAQLAHRLAELLPPGGQLFLGNSLLVRLVDALAQLPVGYPVYCNRGASGIDGLIATLSGIQRGQPRPTLALLGDISALYDLNSLALLRQLSAPLVLVVVNNNGGRIFSLLPTPVGERERFFTLPQSVSFAPAAQMFGLDYQNVATWEPLQHAVQQGFTQRGGTLVEFSVPPDRGAETFARLVAMGAAL
ncbi:2-succinyl-5-enolpyruvyl-6-hydroxy-3-cyclohexene-1-carboxylic-acid synthase [Mixta theicola]|uniref:2-succinyl-5-enolpyruvyl-6-hydroxy-3-cyclohexene-1-carboxylate synthase n=1 Tax=Mixta theicola TaxID=1458355 RepID=A0A2K1QAX4_9GAMM|nr:2-succinyl-5-enolpyruvyl-6-hydroxy-3-cyclohexene-1-carboxylic-acid synthase [Mixta theicola]PNS12184.1 2-succinyl-5-enolpyruvyl-6-hydroxy-3-cyclohexene-1-carboxylic-acid synthase [Mixta theicola]GLR10711.1 2-succinyl-5-enolpyruvyl-6-hydroxy-3-cyclohexene- 1-carboxylate synthase [Mixta theicola]